MSPNHTPEHCPDGVCKFFFPCTLSRWFREEISQHHISKRNNSLPGVAPCEWHYYSVPLPSAAGSQVQVLSNPVLYIYKGQSDLFFSSSTGLTSFVDSSFPPLVGAGVEEKEW